MTSLSQHQDFAPLVGKRFDFEGQNVGLLLVSVDVKRLHPGAPADRIPFTLIFHGPRGAVLPEGLYRARIGNDAVADLYVMPIHTPEPDRQTYQAVFN